MKKLFAVLRQGNIEEVKRIVGKNPELVNCVSGPTPKKDHGQSPLQVSLKAGQFEIADFLINHGADVNFIEAEDDDPGLRAPVLFDAITATIMSLCYNNFAASDIALGFVKKLIEKGADVNSFASNGLGTINWAIHNAEQIIQHPTLYTQSQDAARDKLAKILDLLIENGADCMAWANRGYYADPYPGPTSRSLFIDPTSPDKEFEVVRVRSIREFLQDYFKSRDIRF